MGVIMVYKHSEYRAQCPGIPPVQFNSTDEWSWIGVIRWISFIDC